MIESERILSVESSTEVDNKIEVDDGSSLFEGSLKNVFRRKKIGKRYFRRMSVFIEKERGIGKVLHKLPNCIQILRTQDCIMLLN